MSPDSWDEFSASKAERFVKATQVQSLCLVREPKFPSLVYGFPLRGKHGSKSVLRNSREEEFLGWHIYRAAATALVLRRSASRRVLHSHLNLTLFTGLTTCTQKSTWILCQIPTGTTPPRYGAFHAGNLCAAIIA